MVCSCRCCGRAEETCRRVLGPGLWPNLEMVSVAVLNCAWGTAYVRCRVGTSDIGLGSPQRPASHVATASWIAVLLLDLSTPSLSEQL